MSFSTRGAVVWGVMRKDEAKVGLGTLRIPGKEFEHQGH